MSASWNLEEKDKFLEENSLPRLTHEEIENLNRPILRKESSSIFKILPTKRRSEPNGFPGEFEQTFKEHLMLKLLKVFPKIKEREHSKTHSSDASITLVPKPDKDPARKLQINISYEYRYKILNILAN